MAESRWEAEQRRRDAKARIARFDEADWQARRRRAERAEGTRRAALALIFAGPGFAVLHRRVRPLVLYDGDG